MSSTHKHIDMTKTGYNLCRLLNENQLSASEVAKQLNVSPAAVCKWLHGLSMPSLDHLACISHLLNVPMSKIVISKTAKNKPETV